MDTQRKNVDTSGYVSINDIPESFRERVHNALGGNQPINDDPYYKIKDVMVFFTEICKDTVEDRRAEKAEGRLLAIRRFSDIKDWCSADLRVCHDIASGGPTNDWLLNELEELREHIGECVSEKTEQGFIKSGCGRWYWPEGAGPKYCPKCKGIIKYV